MLNFSKMGHGLSHVAPRAGGRRHSLSSIVPVHTMHEVALGPSPKKRVSFGSVDVECFFKTPPTPRDEFSDLACTRNTSDDLSPRTEMYLRSKMESVEIKRSKRSVTRFAASKPVELASPLNASIWKRRRSAPDAISLDTHGTSDSGSLSPSSTCSPLDSPISRCSASSVEPYEV